MMTRKLTLKTDQNAGGEYVLHGRGRGAAVSGTGGGSARLLHTMLRVRDLERALDFYTGPLGMRVLRQKEFPEGGFTLAFLGYVEEDLGTVLELTHNWDGRGYQPGTAYGHVAIGVPDVLAATASLEAAGVAILRRAGPLPGDPSEIIAFVEDPDGYRIELIQRPVVPTRPVDAGVRLSNYLFFTNQCEPALTFYTECGLGHVAAITRFGDGGRPVTNPAMRGKVLHALFEGSGVRFYASDNDDAEPMRGSAHILMMEDREWTAALFARLGAGGRVTTPLAVQSWGDFYGKLTDRFGIQWMLNCPAEPAHATETHIEGILA